MKKISIRAQVLAYVMQNPAKTRMEIAKGMGYDHKSIALALKHWQMQGKLYCKAAGKNSTWSV